MASKATVTFILASFKMGLSIVPNWSTLGKSVKDVSNSIPKAIAPELSAEEDKLVESFKTLKTAGNFQNAISAFGKWVDDALTVVNRIEESDFESRRGRNTAELVVELFGQKLSCLDHAMLLLEGSKLHEFLSSETFKTSLTEGEFQDLHSVINVVKSALGELVPEEFRPKRTRKGNETPNELPAEPASELQEEDSDDSENDDAQD